MSNARAICAMTLFALFFAIPAPVAAQDTASEPGRTIEAKSDTRTDAAIARRVADIFQQLEALQGVEVTVAAGVVTLRGTVLDSASADQAEQLASRVAGVAAVRNEIAIEASVEKRLVPVFGRLQDRLTAAYELAPLFAVALVIFAVIVILGLWLASLRSPWDRIAPNAFVADLIRQILRFAFFAGGLLIALDIIGATALLSTILGAAGIVGLAVGFALRDTIENYAASIMLSIRQPFRPNDFVRIDGHEGHVVRLTSRATLLLSLDGNHIRIPNADVFKGVIVNYTRNPERRFEFTIGVAADTNLKHAVDIGCAGLRELDFVLNEPDPLGIVDSIGDSNVVLWFAAWIDQRTTDFGKARGEAIRLTKRALEDAGIDLPEPIYRVRMEQPAAPQTAAVQPEVETVESPEVGDASKETAVPDKVTEERTAQRERDLLDPAAPPE